MKIAGMKYAIILSMSAFNSTVLSDVVAHDPFNELTYELLDAKIHERLLDLYSDEGEDVVDDINSLIRLLKLNVQLLGQRNETNINLVKILVNGKGLECLKIAIHVDGLQKQFRWEDENVNMCFHLLTELKIIWSVLELRYDQFLFAKTIGLPMLNM